MTKSAQRADPQTFNSKTNPKTPLLTFPTTQVKICPCAVLVGHHTNVAAFDSSLRRTKPQANILVPSSALANLLALRLGLGVEEDMGLLLERTFRLHSQLGRHSCERVSPTRQADVELCR